MDKGRVQDRYRDRGYQLIVTVHVIFNRRVFVDGRLAAETSKDCAEYFVAAYKLLFPQSLVEAMTPLQSERRDKKRQDDSETDEVEQGIDRANDAMFPEAEQAEVVDE
jgi:hypothetical protein